MNNAYVVDYEEEFPVESGAGNFKIVFREQMEDIKVNPNLPPIIENKQPEQILKPSEGTIVEDNNIVGKKRYINAESGLTLRGDPGIQSDKITTIPDRSEITVIGNKRITKDGIEWVDVEYNGQKGWVASSYLRESKKEMNFILLQMVL